MFRCRLRVSLLIAAIVAPALANRSASAQPFGIGVFEADGVGNIHVSGEENDFRRNIYEHAPDGS